MAKYISFIVLFFVSCQVKSNDQYTIDYGVAEEFGIDKTKISYLYYQKFGFTDVCEDIRIVSKQVSPGLQKTLPISFEDLKRINEFPNKVDDLRLDSISFSSNTRGAFIDIELDYQEYKPEKSILLYLNEGEYEIIQTEFSSILKVYDSQTQQLYIEVHRCDGN